jgi:hypothetical protein
LGLPSKAYTSTSSFAAKHCGSIFGPCNIPLSFDFGAFVFCVAPVPFLTAGLRLGICCSVAFGLGQHVKGEGFLLMERGDE